MYVKCGKIMEVCSVFDRMIERNVVCWSAMVSGYAREEYASEVNGIFKEMRSSGVVPVEAYPSISRKIELSPV
ncbi:hypothetical protein GIB67_007980 [Kingdonia uniflora]|uniref:Pentatricopeptide repeat-containing protein n=1 Tax=Kingdonia uniflora TaxID=39325 RepID=A0A7J7L9F1_9MAGN|nr:hypothetical protein GIB67_007980 [Kingdonia uniflora]